MQIVTAAEKLNDLAENTTLLNSDSDIYVYS